MKGGELPVSRVLSNETYLDALRLGTSVGLPPLTAWEAIGAYYDSQPPLP